MDPFHSVEAPTRVKRVGGIRQVAEVDSGVSRLFIGGRVGYEAPECGTALGTAVLCYPSNGGAQEPKNYDGIEIFEGISPAEGFYAGTECYLGGGDFEAEATRSLEERIDLQIEKSINTWAQATATAEAETSFLEAVAVLDGKADAEYAGRPVIFINRSDAVRARAQKALFGDKEGNLWTVNGTPVVSSSSITPGFVFATGAVKVIETPTTTTRSIAHTVNREQAIAERAFAVVIDCKYLIAATVA